MPDGDDAGTDPQGTGTGDGGEPNGEPQPTGEGKPPEGDDLDQWKAHSRRHETAAKDARRDAAKLKTELEELRSRTATDEEKAIAQARKEGEQSALDRANARTVRAAVIVAASGKLADPTDAASLLDLNGFDVDEEGNVDDKAVAEAIADLLKAKPHLAARPTKPQGDVGQGPQGNGESQTPDMDKWLRDAREGTFLSGSS